MRSRGGCVIRQRVKILLMILALTWQGIAVADLSVTHRIISTKNNANGAQITLHLHITNQGEHHYLDLTLTPVDPSLLPTPNEVTVSVDSLAAFQESVIPWKMTLPYSGGKFHSDLPIAFQGRATDENGNAHAFFIFSNKVECRECD